ncbi:hypothetical protein MMC07_003591 [Pseudocyphellaria aurata]|nr:hypothetical protein [Pseudocyphellaria aurata]
METVPILVILGDFPSLANFIVENAVIASSLVLGLLSHWLYFIRGEHHLHALLFVKLFFWLPILSCLSLVLLRVPFARAVQLTASVAAAYLGALWTSIIIYRTLFHRLHHFPGPALARTSKLYHVAQLGQMKNFRQLAAWHQRYGDFVRIGPAELSIISPNAANAILGPSSTCLRSPWYDNDAGVSQSLLTIRSPQLHESRRRLWDRAFSVKALRGYEGRVVGYTNELVDQIVSRLGQPMDVSTWFNYYSFDVMGDLAFGKSFDMLKNSCTHYIMDAFEKAMLPVGVLSPLPWIIPIFASAPIIGADFAEFIRWCGGQVETRMKMEVKVPDISSWLFENSDQIDRRWLNGDGRLIVVAGSDTTAAAMTYAFYHLASDRTQVEKLRAELQTLMKPDTPFSARDVQSGPHLNGVIYEALRMHPPVPSGAPRITPPEGITVDDVFVPGGVNVTVPQYVLGRSEACYVQPNDFIPERWYSRPELIKSKNAYAPFSLGHYSCVGKQLALMELRTVISLLITRFDVAFAPGEDGSTLLNDAKDTFTMRLAALNLVFVERQKSGE